MMLGHCILFLLISYSYGQSLTSSASVVKRPGESVTLSCTVSGFSMGSNYMHWIRQKPGKGLEWIGRIDRGTGTTFAQSLQGQFSITKDTNKNMLYLEVKSLKAQETAVYYCAGENIVMTGGGDWAFDYWGKGTAVTVTSAVQSAPKSLFPVWQCGSASDGLVTLGCVTRDLASADGVSFIWKDASGSALTDVVQYPAVQATGGYTSVSHVRVKASDWNGNKKFTCEVKNGLGSKDASLQKPAQRVTEPNITMSTNTMDNNVNLLCWLDGFSPKKISVEWYKGNTLHTKKTTMKIFESLNNGEKTFGALSQLSINAEQWNEGTEFTCKATHISKIFSQTWSKCKAEPTSKPLIRLEKPGLMSVLTDSEVTASCVVETVHNTKVSWFVDGKEKTDRVTLKTLDGRTVSNLTISTNDWKNWQTIKCTAAHLCFGTVEKTINILEPVQKTPTVVIRRNLADILKGDSAVLECAARDLPSGELSVILQANGIRVFEPQYVDLPKGVDTLTARFTVSTTQRNKNQRFTCQIQQSRSKQWTSNSIENLFGDPSVELLVISSVDKSASATQKLICAATGLNPNIKWLPESVVNALNGLSKVTVDSDGRVKVSSEISVPQQQWNNRVTFTCRVSDQDPLKPVEKSTSICAVTPDFAQKAQVYLLAPSISDMRANHVSVTCLLLRHRLNDFSIVWKIGKDNTSQVVTTQPLRVHSNGRESVRSILKVPARKWKAYTTVSCEVTHLCSTTKMEHTISKTRDRKSPTVRILSPSDDDLSGVRNTNLLCLVDGFRPADISVHWELNDRQLDASKFINSPVGNASALGDYSMHSVLILPASKRENSTFSCVVSHESSEKPIRNSINNVYASVTENRPSVVLLQGQNKLVCLVYGYSPSAINITWLLNSVSVQHDNSTKSSAKRPDGKFSIKSHLKVQASEWAPGDTYTCQVKHITGIVTRDISKKEFTEETIYFDENTSETSTLDQAEETWNMACAFIILFVISLLYGCSVTLVKVKIA
nr:Ig heavy chain - channel catfish [Ictalurus punctatus]AAC60133.1 immunoglobulin heavy chain [Ictalurus punctatus]